MLHHTVTYTIPGHNTEYRLGITRRSRLTSKGCARIIAWEYGRSEHSATSVRPSDVTVIRVQVAITA